MQALDDIPALALSDEVAEALAAHQPVVALETTLLAHGLPRHRRSEVALELEAACRSEGAAPATIAILEGRMRVGLQDSELTRIIYGSAEKASIRDLAPALALGGAWATTVASTVEIARRAGVRWFATGGLGGVHRGVVETFDESADLAALASCPVGVVCAGAKAVLDLPRTLERLETLGVPVLGYQTSELPAFYHGSSGLSVSCRVDTPEEAARVAVARFDRLGQGGLLVCQAPPAEMALDPQEVEAQVQAALDRAQVAGIRGRALTPFLLAELEKLTDGRSVETNVALVKENVRLAARIAVTEAHLRSRRAGPRPLEGPDSPS